MDPNWQGGDPNGRGAYYNYFTAQRFDHPSSSSRPRFQPQQLFTSWSQFLPQGAYDPRSFGVGIPTHGNISGYDFVPLAVTMPGPPAHHYSGSGWVAPPPRTPMPNDIRSQYQYQYQPHPPDSDIVFPAPGNSNRVIQLHPPRAGVYAQQPGSGTVFSAPGYNYDSSVAPHATFYPPGVAVYPQQPGSGTDFSAPGYNYNSSVDPHANVYPPAAAVYGQQPGSANVFFAPGHIPHASVNQPRAPLYAQPGAATDFFARDGNANNDPYTTAGLIAPPANANQGAASRGPVAGVPDHLRLSFAALATNPETSGKLISMLNQDSPELRVLVTRWVLEDVRMVMGSHTGHAVLLALLGAIERANMLSSLEAIVNGAASHQYNGAPLMEVATSCSAGEIALKELVRLAALHLHPTVLRRLFRCLIHGWNMEQSNGTGLLQHFFTTLPIDHCSIFLDDLAIARFWDMVTTRIGYMSLTVCLENAGYTEQGTTLQNIIVTQTVRIANDRYGSCFLRAVLERGRNDQLEERVRERVVHNLVKLSMGRYGNKVVQECFVPRDVPSVPLLERGLDAFLRLTEEQLRELAQNHWAGYVLRRLLRTSLDRNVAAEEATKLAEAILEAVATGDETDAELPRPEGDPREQAIAILH